MNQVDHTKFLKEVGKKVRKARMAKGLNIIQLSIMLGNNHFTGLGNIERGQVGCRITTLKQIADVLEVDVKDFL